jgi:hypothetical protein
MEGQVEAMVEALGTEIVRLDRSWAVVISALSGLMVATAREAGMDRETYLKGCAVAWDASAHLPGGAA